MAKRRIEEELQQLAALRQGEGNGAIEAALAKALRDRVNVMVAKAASVASERQLVSLLPDMLTAYDRLFADPVKSDPQCWGKNALAKALKDLGHAEAAPFLKGVRHLQMEAVWGGEVDTAPGLRATCALALVQCTDIPAHQILSVLVDALADNAAPVRQDAVQALAQWGSPEAILLLRLKARLGDMEPAVTGNIFDALLRLQATEALDFIGSFLESREEATLEEAALSLGSSKLQPAIELLIEKWNQRRVSGPFEVWIRAFGASRLPSAFEILLGIIRGGRHKEAPVALMALQSWRLTAASWGEIAVAVSSRHEEELQSAFLKDFPHPEQT